MAQLDRTESSHNGCLSVLTSCFRASGQSESPGPKTKDEQTTFAQNSGNRAVNPASSSSGLTREQISCGPPDKTDVPVQNQGEGHELGTPEKREHLSAATNLSGLWQEALEQSDEETKKKIKQLYKTEKHIQIDQLTNLIRDKREAFKADTPSVKIRGKEVIWRDCAARVISMLTVLGDVASQFAPAPASAVWSALKVLLKANVTQCAEMVAVLGCIEKVLPLVRRGAIYEYVFLRRRSDASCKSSMNLRESLVEAYKQVLQILVRAERKIDEKSIVRFWYTLQNPEEVLGLIKDFHDAEARIYMDAHACHVEQGQVNQKELLEGLGHLDRPLQELARIISKSEFDQTMNFVSHVHVGNQHYERTRRRLSGTGDWLLKHEDFMHWKQSASSEILWLTGQVGAGKTVLASHVVDRCMIDGAEKSQANGEGLAYFYYSKADQETRDESSACVMRSFVKQLFMLQCCPAKLQTNLMHRIDEANKAHRTFLTDLECEILLLSFLNEIPRTYLILDGLDEFPESDAIDMITSLKNMIRRSQGSAKLFVSSRDEGHIRKTFYATKYQQHLLEINISHENQTDIEKFIETETEKNFSAYVVEKRNYLIERLVDGSNGMFRWAYLQVEQLKKCKSWKAVLERLDNLPKGLTETYDELYDRNEGSDRTYLQRAVKWVTLAYEPLPTRALLSAIQLGQNAHGMLQVDDCLEEEELENICRHLISKTSDNNWKFTHASVKEYFQDEQNERLRTWTGNTAQIDLAILLVLLFTGYKDWPDSTTHQKRKWYNETSWPSRNHSQDPQRYLRRYIGRYWITHVKDIQHLPIERSLVLQLLKPFIVTGKFPYQSSPQYQEWIQTAAAKCHILEFDSRGRLDRYQDALPADNSIFGIVALGFFPMLQDQEIEHLDLEQTNKRGLGLLAIAARYGYTETCARLIDLGCKVNGIYQISRTFNRRAFYEMCETSALLEAVSHDQANCVQLILRKNADANLDSDTCALHKAAATADFATMKTLLICGAKMNVVCQTCRFQHALELTSALN